MRNVEISIVMASVIAILISVAITSQVATFVPYVGDVRDSAFVATGLAVFASTVLTALYMSRKRVARAGILTLVTKLTVPLAIALVIRFADADMLNAIASTQVYLALVEALVGGMLVGYIYVHFITTPAPVSADAG